MASKNQFSHCTAKERDKMSFPSRLLFDKKLIVGETLDFGCGFGKDVGELKKRGLDITGYDPEYFLITPQKLMILYCVIMF